MTEGFGIILSKIQKRESGVRLADVGQPNRSWLMATHKHIPLDLNRIEGGGRLLVAFGPGRKGQETDELVG